MNKTAFFFAGQGAQYPGMGMSLCEVSPAARAVFEAAEAIRPGTSEQCFHGSAEELAETINTQPCLFIMDLAAAHAAREAGIQPSMVAGFSLGELAAVAYTEMLPFDEAFRLVIKRAELMQRCAAENPGAMAAVLRLQAAEVEALCARIADIYPVNYNAPTQTVVSGSEQGLAALEAAVKEAGGRVMRLAVSGSFHSPFMKEASEGLRAYMSTLTFTSPTPTLYSNVTAEPYKLANCVDLLAEQVQKPVLFTSLVQNMIAEGVTHCIEVGAGKTLSGLIKKIDPTVTVAHVQDAESLYASQEAMKEIVAC